MEAMWAAVTAFEGAIIVAMIVPILSGTWVRRAEYDRTVTKHEAALELLAVHRQRLEEKDKTISLLERVNERLETEADISTKVLNAVKAVAQGGGGGS